MQSMNWELFLIWLSNLSSATCYPFFIDVYLSKIRHFPNVLKSCSYFPNHYFLRCKWLFLLSLVFPLFYFFIYIWWILFAFSSLQLKLFTRLSVAHLCSLIRWSEAFGIRSPGYKWFTSNIVHLHRHNFFLLCITNFLIRLSVPCS